jgi:hypothetical protein
VCPTPVVSTLSTTNHTQASTSVLQVMHNNNNDNKHNGGGWAQSR